MPQAPAGTAKSVPPLQDREASAASGAAEVAAPQAPGEGAPTEAAAPLTQASAAAQAEAAPGSPQALPAGSQDTSPAAAEEVSLPVPPGPPPVSEAVSAAAAESIHTGSAVALEPSATTSAMGMQEQQQLASAAASVGVPPLHATAAAEAASAQVRIGGVPVSQEWSKQMIGTPSGSEDAEEGVGKAGFSMDKDPHSLPGVLAEAESAAPPSVAGLEGTSEDIDNQHDGNESDHGDAAAEGEDQPLSEMSFTSANVSTSVSDDSSSEETMDQNGVHPGLLQDDATTESGVTRASGGIRTATLHDLLTLPSPPPPLPPPFPASCSIRDLIHVCIFPILPEDMLVNPAAGKVGKHKELRKKFMTFADARDLIRSQGFISRSYFMRWKPAPGSSYRYRPESIPVRPDNTYSEHGWTSWSDFLGLAGTEEAPDAAQQAEQPQPQPQSASKSGSKRDFLAFPDARAVVRMMHRPPPYNLVGWRKVCSLGKRPINIPSRPEQVYAADWKGFPDFMCGSDDEGQGEAAPPTAGGGSSSHSAPSQGKSNFPMKPRSVRKAFPQLDVDAAAAEADAAAAQPLDPLPTPKGPSGSLSPQHIQHCFFSAFPHPCFSRTRILPFHIAPLLSLLQPGEGISSPPGAAVSPSDEMPRRSWCLQLGSQSGNGGALWRHVSISVPCA